MSFLLKDLNFIPKDRFPMLDLLKIKYRDQFLARLSDRLSRFSLRTLFRMTEEEILNLGILIAGKI